MRTSSQQIEEDGFDVFVTGDRGVAFEQNLAGRQLAIIALSTNNWPIIQNYVPQILAAIDAATPGSFQTVDCGTFSRKSIDEEYAIVDIARFAVLPCRP